MSVALMERRCARSGLASVAFSSDGYGEFVERDADPVVYRDVGSQFVVAAAQVLHECVPGRDGACGGQSFESAHRPQPRLEPAMIGFHPIVLVLLGHMASGRDELV